MPAGAPFSDWLGAVPVAITCSAPLAGRFSTEKRVISCGLPLSKSWKSCCRKPFTTRPWRSRTTTGTITRLTWA